MPGFVVNECDGYPPGTTENPTDTDPLRRQPPRDPDRPEEEEQPNVPLSPLRLA
jgi:hypothetical protein